MKDRLQFETRARSAGLRFCTLGLALVLFIVASLAASPADAAGISIVNVSSTGSSVSELAVGDILTVELVANNDTNLEIYGIGISAFGYEGSLEMVGVEAVSSIFNTTVLSDGTPIGGFETNYANRGLEAVLDGTLRTALYLSADLSPHTGDGSFDLGLRGTPISEGDVHFRISFRATSLLDTTELEVIFDANSAIGDAVVGTQGILLPFERSTLRVAVLGDPDYVAPPGDDGEEPGGSTGGGGGQPGGGTGGSGGNGGSTGGGGVVGAVPEPAGALLFAAGLLTIRLAGRR
ncbi:MAG: hypothetical protein R3F21_17060 [Myxococcota bacterium]